MKNIFLATAIISSASAGTASAAELENSGTGPALWRISDEDDTLYIFGSLHALPKDLEWQSPAIKKAFNASEELYLELNPTDPDTRNDILRYFAIYGLNPPGVSLTSQLTEEQAVILRQRVDELGLDIKQMESLKPWYAALIIQVEHLKSQGYSESAEAVFLRDAETRSKPVKVLETAEDQFGKLASMPKEAQIYFLMESLLMTAPDDSSYRELLRSWYNGELIGATAQDIIQMSDNPAAARLHRDLLTERNTRWAEKIHGLMQDDKSDSAFFAVGAAHLPDLPNVIDGSLIEKLRNMGYQVERVNPPRPA